MIYPKDYSLIKRDIRINEAFVLMPFDAAFDWVFQAIQSACDNLGITAFRADNLFGSAPIIEKILTCINSSEIIIADLTGRNANVFYEVGIAHTLRNCNSIILLAQHLEDVPFDLRHLNIIIYSSRGRRRFKESLINTINTSRLNYSSDEYVKQLLLAYNYPIAEIDSLIQYLKQNHLRKYTLFAAILRTDKDVIESNKEMLDTLSVFFIQITEYQSGLYAKMILTLWNKLLLSDFIMNEHKELIINRLNIDYSNPVINHIQQYEIDIMYYTAQLCIMLCDKNDFRDIAIRWLFNYMTNRRMGRIDSIRTTIERFFVETSITTINDELIKNIANSSATVRESIADICGEKKLESSIVFLIHQLKAEDNPYVVRSIVAALGKMSVKECAPIVVNWMAQHPEKWGNSNCGSLERVVMEAFTQCNVDSIYFEKVKAIHSSE